MRKLFAILLSLFLLAGCTQKQTNQKTITLWHWITDRHDVLIDLATQYKAQTGIKVQIELYAPSDAYSQKIIAAAQARVLPDIYGILDKKKIFASFVKSGVVADLTEDFKANNAAWQKSISPKALAVNQFEANNIYGVKPGTYGVPIDLSNTQMLYNKDLLEKAGIKTIPMTFDEFLTAVDALNRVGIPGLVSGWGELWMVECFASNYAFNIMGEEKIMDTFRGKIPYTDPDWIKVLDVFKKLSDRGALIDGIVTKNNKTAENDFALGRAAFAFNGSWCVNVYYKMNSQLKYGAMLPPSINPDLPMRIWGGAGSSFVVNAGSPRKKEAIDFLKWLTAPSQQIVLTQETKNLPSNQEALAEVPEVLSEFAQAMEYTTHQNIWPYNEDPVVLEAFVRGIQSIIIGEKTPLQVGQEVQEVKERQMQKVKN